MGDVQIQEQVFALSDSELELEAAKAIGYQVQLNEDGFYYVSHPRKEPPRGNRSGRETWRFVPHFCAELSSAMELVEMIVSTEASRGDHYSVHLEQTHNRATCSIMSDLKGMQHRVEIEGAIKTSLPKAITIATVLWWRSQTSQG